MRFITKAAVVAGALATGVGLAAGPAAAASHTWRAGHSFANEAASGTYQLAGKNLTVNGKLSDLKADGWTACVIFKFTRGATAYYSMHYIVDKKTHGLADGKVTIPLSPTHMTSPSHFYVASCRIGTKTGKLNLGTYGKVF